MTHTNDKPVIATASVISAADPRTIYTVSIHNDLSISCECHGWKNRGVCKHLWQPSVAKAYAELFAGKWQEYCDGVGKKRNAVLMLDKSIQ